MWCYLLLLPLVSTAQQCDGNVLLQHHAQSGPTALVEDEVSKSVCSHGRLMPNFYILGSAKAGSSTLGKVLLRAGITSSSYVVDGERKKESQLLRLGLKSHMLHMLFIFLPVSPIKGSITIPFRGRLQAAVEELKILKDTRQKNSPFNGFLLSKRCGLLRILCAFQEGSSTPVFFGGGRVDSYPG